MNARSVALLFVLVHAGSPAIDPALATRNKIRLIQAGRVRPGSTLEFTPAELNAYAKAELPGLVPQGVRQPRLELGNGTASGSALIDFLRLRHAQGSGTPWLLAKLIEGERPVKVEARIQSAHGTATVYLERVEISGLAVSGSTLDFLIKTFFLPLYPDAKINEPFALNTRVDHIEVAPAHARVVMRK